MSSLLTILSLPWFAPLAGLIAILAFIWLAAPLLSTLGLTWLDSSTNLVILSLLLVLLFAVIVGLRYYRNKSKNKKLTDELSGKDIPAGEKAADSESEKLGEIFRRALDDLKTNEGGGKQKDYLYRLPWYIIIGPPGCGKTTALINSGLKFPLAEKYGQHKIQGVGGTRYCDWWFSEDAVLLDTAGRYSTQDSNETADKSAWDKFLGLLKKHRPKRPINGVILAISLSELLQSEAAYRAELAVRLRQRLQELRKTLGIQFPIYVMFTKLDLISGAMEFFGRFDKDDRRQVFGFTYPYEAVVADPGYVVANFDSEFELLIDSLDRRLVDRLQEERDEERREQVYAFTKQFASLKPVLREFFSDLFSPSRYESVLNVRGTYFSSGTQEGRPIDRIRARILQLFKLSGAGTKIFDGQGRAYFLDRLFREVLFPESGLAGTDIKAERRSLWVRRGIFAAIGLVTGLWVVAWLSVYWQQQSYVESVNEQLADLNRTAETLNQGSVDIKDTLQLLDTVRDVPGAEETNGFVFWQGLGLSQAAKLGRAARTTYTKALEQVLLPRLLVQLEERLSESIERTQALDLQSLYVTLQTYLLFDRRRYGDHFKAEIVADWFSEEWATDARLLPEQRESLQRHLTNLLGILSDTLPFPPDDALIAEVRGALPNTLDASQVLLQLQRPLEGVPAFNLNDISKRKMALVVGRVSGAPLTEGIASTYTVKGYPLMLEAIDRRVKELSEGDWVLNLPPLGVDESTDLKQGLVTGYQDEYCREWTKLLTDIKLLEPKVSLKDAVDKLNILADDKSPLRLLIDAVIEETKPVEACFEELHAFVGGEPPTELDSTFERLEGLTVLLIPLADFQSRMERLDPSIVRSIQAEAGALASNKPFPLNNWLGDFINIIPSLLDQGITSQLNRVWKSEVLPFCRRAIRGRYPVAGGSSEDINIADFTKFFAAGGLLDSFLASGDMNLAQYVDMSRSPWVWRAFDTREQISAKTLKALESGHKIAENYFPKGASPDVRFGLRLVRLDPGLSAVVFDFHGETNLMRQDDPAVTVEWPPKSNKPLQVELYRRADDPKPVTVVHRGDWALFRLFDQARIRKRAADRFEIRLSSQGASAVFEISAESVFNPLNANPQAFVCPDNL